MIFCVASLPSTRRASASPLESFCVSVHSIRSCALPSADPPSIVHVIVHHECNAPMTQLCNGCAARMGRMRAHEVAVRPPMEAVATSKSN
jgi:hypothetical protein